MEEPEVPASSTEDEPPDDLFLVGPNITADGHPFVHVTVAGHQFDVSAEEARVLGEGLFAGAADAEQEAALYRWMMSNEGSSRDGVIRIVTSFRQFRASEAVGETLETVSFANQGEG